VVSLHTLRASGPSTGADPTVNSHGKKRQSFREIGFLHFRVPDLPVLRQ
jgi:hypothetical protein